MIRTTLRLGSSYISRQIMALHTSSKTMSNDEVEAMRINYDVDKLGDGDLPSKNPFEFFNAWFQEAVKHDGIVEANAMNIATATRDGIPSSRMVLLKGFSEEGFRFFSNYCSEKGKHLEENPNIAVNFYWEPLHKQIRINGSVEKLSEEESTEYFHKRPRASQIGALVSRQSTPIRDSQVLEDRRIELEQKYKDVEIPKPDYWGGYLVKPRSFEFWVGGSGRLHDRILFRHLKPGENIDPALTKKGENDWYYERLSP